MGPLIKPLSKLWRHVFSVASSAGVEVFPKQGVHEEGVIKFDPTIWEWAPMSSTHHKAQGES